MLLLRALTRLVGILLMLALALLGLGLSLYCFDGFVRLGSARPDRLLGLPGVRRHVGHFLSQLAAPGATAGLALLGGLMAVLIGLVLLVGTLRSSKQRLAVLDSDATAGRLAVRPGTLRAMARALAEQAPGATSVRRPKLALSRQGGRGRLTVTASRARASDGHDVKRAVAERIEPISGPFKLRSQVRVRLGQRGDRVQ